MSTKKRFSRRALVWLALVATMVGCNDDGGTTTADMEGMWLIDSFAVMENGVPVTLTRDGSPRALRADLVLTPTGDTTATWTLRLTDLQDGLLVRPVTVDTHTITLEESKLIVVDNLAAVTVFDYAFSGDKLDLTWDESDARNTSDNPPTAVALARVAPWGTSSVGSWDILSITTTSGTTTPDTCQEVTPGQLWATNTMTVVISERHLFERTAQFQTYLDAACTVAYQALTDVQGGMAEEAGSTLRIWTFSAQNPQASEYLDFTMTISGDDMTLTRNSCLPTATCVDNSPTAGRRAKTHQRDTRPPRLAHRAAPKIPLVLATERAHTTAHAKKPALCFLSERSFKSLLDGDGHAIGSSGIPKSGRRKHCHGAFDFDSASQGRGKAEDQGDCLRRLCGFGSPPDLCSCRTTFSGPRC